MDNPLIFCCLTQNVARTVFPICARLRHECKRSWYLFATVNLEAGVEPYDLRLCLMVFHSCDYLIVENKCLKAAGKCAVEGMSFVTCLGSKCSYYNDLSSPLLIHEIIYGDSIDRFATAPGRK